MSEPLPVEAFLRCGRGVSTATLAYLKVLNKCFNITMTGFIEL